MLTVKAAAKRAKVGEATVWRVLADGRLKKYRRPAIAAFYLDQKKVDEPFQFRQPDHRSAGASITVSKSIGRQSERHFAVAEIGQVVCRASFDSKCWRRVRDSNQRWRFCSPQLAVHQGSQKFIAYSVASPSVH